MKKLSGIALVLLLTGCVAPGPYYVPPPQPVYVQPRPVYIPPPPPRCWWTKQWDSYYRTYRNVRVCR